MEPVSRIWFTPKQRAELWERWRSGQCVADIARALRRPPFLRASDSDPGLGCYPGTPAFSDPSNHAFPSA